MFLNLTKHDMLVVQKITCSTRDEELTSICVPATVCLHIKILHMIFASNLLTGVTEIPVYGNCHISYNLAMTSSKYFQFFFSC